jgi:hypothetical protein
MLNVDLIRDKGIAIISPNGKLEASDFERVGHVVDPFIEAHGMLDGLLIRADSFSGWADFAALVTHVRFVRDHHRKVRRIAAVSDNAFLKVLPAIAEHFVAAEIRHFPIAEIEPAMDWLEAGRLAQTE